MDELKLRLNSKLMRGIVTKLISKAIFKKYGYNVDIVLNKIEVEHIDGTVHLHADLDAKTSNEDFVKIVKSVGLD